jgi:AcrR family transcriptional regulator
MATGSLTTPSNAAMISAAEQLVAERGLGAVSMRMVGEAAGQRNHSAVQFHFGSWEGLLQSIAADRMGPINQERLALLKRLDHEGRSADVRGLVEALVVPLSNATIRRPGSFYARFLAASYADPQW